MNGADKAVDFDCAVNVTSQAVEIRISVANTGSAEVAVFDRIQVSNPDGTVAFPSDIAYLDLCQEVLVVRKVLLAADGRFPLPAGYRPAFASRLGAGQRLSEVVRLPVPVMVMNPFAAVALGASGEVAASEPGTARAIKIEVGVLASTERIQLHSESPAFPHVLTAFPTEAATMGQEILSKMFPLLVPLPVLAYRAVPWP